MADSFFWLNASIVSLCSCGIITNVLSIIALVKGRKSIPGARILLGLAAADGGGLFALGCKAGAFCWFSNSIDSNFTSSAILDVFRNPVFVGISRGLNTAGIYLVLALATGRYIAVNKPHLAPTWNSKQQQRIIVVVVFTVALLIHVPSFFQNRFTHVGTTQANTTSIQNDKTFIRIGTATGFTRKTLLDPMIYYTTLSPSGFSKSPVAMSSSNLGLYSVLYEYAFNIIVLYLIPLPCLSIINIRFLLGLRRFHNNRRNRFSQTQTEFTSSKQVRVVLNVAVILAVFLLCQFASFAVWLSLGVTYAYSNNSEKEWMTQLACLFLAINCATNFWVYMVFLTEFRQAMEGILAYICRRCRLKDEI